MDVDGTTLPQRGLLNAETFWTQVRQPYMRRILARWRLTFAAAPDAASGWASRRPPPLRCRLHYQLAGGSAGAARPCAARGSLPARHLQGGPGSNPKTLQLGAGRSLHVGEQESPAAHQCASLPLGHLRERDVCCCDCMTEPTRCTSFAFTSVKRSAPTALPSAERNKPAYAQRARGSRASRKPHCRICKGTEVEEEHLPSLRVVFEFRFPGFNLNRFVSDGLHGEDSKFRF